MVGLDHLGLPFVNVKQKFWWGIFSTTLLWRREELKLIFEVEDRQLFLKGWE